jgi:peptidoglycan hydrolase-like protein with peptidoglycan-binding domain
MKNLRTKLLTLGVLATVAMSSTPVFAATNTTVNANTNASKINSTNKITKQHMTLSSGLEVTLSYGSTGQAVSYLQGQLNGLTQSGYPMLGINITVDGVYGTQTENAVRHFQSYFNEYFGGNLAVDGICGPQTWNAINALYDGM